MTRRIALASIYTLFVVTLLWTWPWGPTGPHVDTRSFISAVPVARWLIIIAPIYWAWAAFSLESKHARRAMLAASVALFLACFLFIEQQDTLDGWCLWQGDNCGSRWFN